MDITTRLYLLTGPRGAGKTTFCRALAEQVRAAGYVVAGLISPAVYKNGGKTGILVEDLHTGETRPLASVNRHHPEDIPLGPWYFDPQSLAWGNHVLAGSLPCDLIIMDEIGPLELTHKTGWQGALDILSQRDYRAALVVIRPELLFVAHSQFDFSEVIQIDPNTTIDTLVGNSLPMMGQNQKRPSVQAFDQYRSDHFIRQITPIIDWLEHYYSLTDQS